MSNRRRDPETLAAQALGRIDEGTRALVPPVHVSSTYERDADGGYSSGRGYSRPHNPSYDAPEDLLSELEGGVDCLLFASGMAAATGVFQALLPGDHVIAPRVMYWALRKWLTEFAMPWGLQVEFVDACDLQALADAVRPGETRVIWIETPANPTWDVTDIAAAAQIAHAAGARLAVDSTVATPVLTRPIELGADLVVHSATKYLNGHSDVLAGAIVTATEDAFWNRVRAWRRDGGAILGPFESWLLLRGMRTLFVRVARSSESAHAIAECFAQHPAVAEVLYPGLASHPHHALASQQMRGGFGGMLSIRLAGGQAAAMATAAHVEVFKRATSLGGVESLIEHRASIEGPSTPVPSDLLRLSIGLESAGDLIADLEQALEHASGAHPTSPTPVPASQQTPREPVARGDDLSSRTEAVLQRQLRPLVRERGGDVTLRRVEDGIVYLEYSGSPSACVAIESDIRNMLCHYLSEICDLRLESPANQDTSTTTDDSVESQVERVLREQVNPAVASHGGAVRLVRVDGGIAHILLEGGCQGCAMAEVTVRQGVAILLRRAVKDIVGVIDDTDHAAGRTPYFKTRKG